MALNWDVGDIKNWKEVTTSPFDPKKWHDVTWYLVMACMPVGLRGITEKNKEKFYERLCIYQKMTGPALQYADLDKPGHALIDVYITMEDIERHVGLSVNVGDVSDTVFMTRVRTWAKRDYKITKESNPGNLTAYDWVAKRAAEPKKEAVPDEDKATLTLRLPKDLAQQVAAMPPEQLQTVMENYLKERGHELSSQAG